MLGGIRSAKSASKGQPPVGLGPIESNVATQSSRMDGVANVAASEKVEGDYGGRLRYIGDRIETVGE